MKTKEFLNILRNNSGKELLFEYQTDKFVKKNYHITEVKNITIHSVDCGGSSNNWQETVVQLWENPLEALNRAAMNTEKALKIFDRVNDIRPLLLETEIKIEYGNSDFHTGHLQIHEVKENDQSIIVKLHSDKTQCKASDLCCDPDEKVYDSKQSTKTACC